MKIKHLLLTLMALVLAFSLVGCANRVKKDEAKEQVNAFIDNVRAGNFEGAKEYLHPERPLDIETYFARKELEYGVDFQSGIEITRTDYSSAMYESEVDGGEYELEMNIIVSGVALEMNIDVVRNDNGFGIYSIDIDD